MNKRSAISAGISLPVGEVSTAYFSLEVRSPVSSIGFGAIEVSLWRCSELLPQVSLVLDRAEAILGEVSPTYASFPEVSLGMRPPREFSLEFGALQVSFWRCSDLLPEVSLVFDRTEPILGEIFPTYASLPEVSLEMHSPVSSLSDSVSSRHLFGTVTIYYRWSLQYSIVQKLFLGKSFPHTPAFQRSLWECVPPVNSLSGSVPSRHCFGAVAGYYQRSLQYSIVQKLFLGKYFPYTPAFQRSLWDCAPPVNSLSSSVPSRHLFGAVPGYNQRSLQYSIVQKLLLGRYFPHNPAFLSLEMRSPREFSRGFGTIKASFWHCSDPEVSPVFDRTEVILGEISPAYASLPEVSLEMRPPVSSFPGSVPPRHLFLAL